jgi:DNA-directed RNA polymerase, mitochondrial
MSLLKPRTMALITIMEALRLQGTGGVSEGMKTARAIISVGQAVESEYNAQVRRRHYNNSKRDVTGRLDRYSSPGSDEITGLEAVKARREAAKEEMKKDAAWAASWTPAIRARVGSILLDALMDTATVVRTTTHPRTGLP